MSFSDGLTSNRKRLGLTQENLAEKCGVSRQALAKWEKGEALPDVYTIANLAQLFGVSIEDLIWWKEETALENRRYCIRNMQESDKPAFYDLIIENRYFGNLLNALTGEDKEEYLKRTSEDAHVWDAYYSGGESLAFVEKSSQKLVGFFALYEMNTSGPTVTIQLKKDLPLDDSDIDLIRDCFNWLHRKYSIRVLSVENNSEKEKAIFEKWGYVVGTEGVLLSLPI